MKAAEGPVAVLAGSGRLPAQVVEHLERIGRDFRILAFRGYAAPNLRRRAHAVVDLLDFEAIRRELDRWAPGAVTVVGAVRRPNSNRLLSAYALVPSPEQAREGAVRGDDQLFRGALSTLEEWGHTVVGAHEITPDLLADAGLRVGATAGERDRSAIERGVRVLHTLSPFDIGQATVVSGERVLAVEGPEGTDQMLRRVRLLNRVRWFSRRRDGGVLVKTAKEGQDLRVDMPAIGPRTPVEAAKAGLSGIAIGARSTLILDRAETLQSVERLGLFLVAVDLPWLSGAGS